MIDAARGLCIDVPAALSVVGFDEVEMSTNAGLTTVRQPFEEPRRRLAAILIEAVVSPDREVVCEQLPLEVGARETTGEPVGEANEEGNECHEETDQVSDLHRRPAVGCRCVQLRRLGDCRSAACPSDLTRRPCNPSRRVRSL